jgi:hypothetical protein
MQYTHPIDRKNKQLVELVAHTIQDRSWDSGKPVVLCKQISYRVSQKARFFAPFSPRTYLELHCNERGCRLTGKHIVCKVSEGATRKIKRRKP